MSGIPAEPAVPEPPRPPAAGDAPALIELAGLVAERNDASRRFRLRVPRLALPPGARVAVLGPSGSGKSTLIETIACARAPAAAERFLIRPPGAAAAIDVAAAWASGNDGALTRLRSRMFGYVPQSGGLLDFLTVRDNIALSQRIADRRNPERIERIGLRLGLSALFGAWPSRLSGGQRQRVAIGRAVAHAPAVVVADEPTAALDRVTAREVMTLLCEATARTALVVASHDVALMERFDFHPLRLIEDPEAEGGAAMLLIDAAGEVAP